MGKILLRIAEIAAHEGITIGALEKKIGASKGVLSRAINNGTDIQTKWLELLVENYPTYNPVWLLTGNEEMLFNDSIEKNNESVFYKLYKEKDIENKELIEEIGVLKERIRQLDSEKLPGKDAHHVSTGSHSTQKTATAPYVGVHSRKKSK